MTHAEMDEACALLLAAVAERDDLAEWHRGRGVRDAITAARARASAAEQRAEAAEEALNRLDCAECGRGVAADEDRCCATCGGDCNAYEDGALVSGPTFSAALRTEVAERKAERSEELLGYSREGVKHWTELAQQLRARAEQAEGALELHERNAVPMRRMLADAERDERARVVEAIAAWGEANAWCHITVEELRTTNWAAPEEES